MSSSPLVAQGADLQLIKAAQSGDIMGVRSALSRGADIYRARNPDGYLAIHLAAMNGHVEICRLLAEEDENGLSFSDCKNVKGQSAFYVASESGHGLCLDAILGTRDMH